MARKSEVPITSAVLDWAIAESGLPLSELADISQVSVGTDSSVVANAVRRDIISETQALDYLDIPSSEFERVTADRDQHSDRGAAV